MLKPHKETQRNSFVVEKSVRLSRIEFENFITDMLIEREFIAKNAFLMFIDSNNTWHCIKICCVDINFSLLIMSDKQDYPLWAAYLR